MVLWGCRLGAAVVTTIFKIFKSSNIKSVRNLTDEKTLTENDYNVVFNNLSNLLS